MTLQSRNGDGPDGLVEKNGAMAMQIARQVQLAKQRAQRRQTASFVKEVNRKPELSGKSWGCALELYGSQTKILER
jgi:hypothetical protein